MQAGNWQVAARLVDDWPEQPGDYVFATNSHGVVCALVYCCPCGCGVPHSAMIKIDDSTPRPCWTWNGSRDKPTLRPSLLATIGCCWHGYLTDGVFRLDAEQPQ